jgi:hypothetical protein
MNVPSVFRFCRWIARLEKVYPIFFCSYDNWLSLLPYGFIDFITGSFVPTSRTWGNAQSYVTSNTASLSAKGVHAFVTGIQVSGGDNTVRVEVSANLSILFPSVVPKVVVTQTGVAKLRALTH